MLQNDGNQRQKRFGNKQQRKFQQSQGRKTFLLRWKHRRPELLPHPIHTERNKSKCKSFLQGHTTDRSGKHLSCCITGSQSRLANDEGTWLCCRSLACLRGGAEGGGTPDVDADRPNLQLTLGSAKEERQEVSRGVCRDGMVFQSPFWFCYMSWEYAESFWCWLIIGRWLNTFITIDSKRNFILWSAPGG